MKRLAVLMIESFAVMFNGEEKERHVLFIFLRKEGSQVPAIGFQFLSIQQMREEFGKISDRFDYSAILDNITNFPEESDRPCKVSEGEEAEEMRQAVISMKMQVQPPKLQFERIKVRAGFDGSLMSEREYLFFE